MGEFLATPIKDKVSEENENSVLKYRKYKVDMLHVECKDGEREWKIHIFQI
jgi:hypothetical protein